MEEEIYKVIARLLLSTRKKSNRFLSITEIAHEIKWLKSKLGSINDVSKELKITSGMINQFLSIEKLDDRIQTLVKERKIDSVSVVFSLSKFNKTDQFDLANLIILKKINSQDLRLLRPLRKQYPQMSVNELVNKLLASKNIKISVIQFYIEDLKRNKDSFKRAIINIVSETNINSFDFESTPCLLKITREGETLLRKEADKRKITLKELINLLLN